MASPPDSNLPDPAPWVEIGWVVVPSVSEELQQSVVEAAHLVQRHLGRTFPQYRFHSAVVRRNIPDARGLRELIDLVDLGSFEREASGWDFACVVADEDLHAYEKRFTFGAPASSFNVCALSIARLRPADSASERSSNCDALASRVMALFLHLFGHLNDLPHEAATSNYMYALHNAADLDHMTEFSVRGLALLDDELRKEADTRVEEEAQRRSALQFYVASAWRNREDIVQSVVKAKPWAFMLRLSKLATTAVSALIILMLTEEAWYLGTSQSGWAVALSSVTAVASTAGYVLRRQGLLRRARGRTLSEQRVASNVSVGCIVLAAMLATYVCLFLMSLGFALLAFPESMLRSWASHSVLPLVYSDYLAMAGFVATIGVVLGALGASFEEAKYFRHAAIIDEEA